MPQYAISSTPVSASTINGAMFRSSTTTLSLNERYSRMYTRTATNATISYNSFVNVPGFILQAGLAATWTLYDFEYVDVSLSANMPGMQSGDPFTLVLATADGFGTYAPTTHHGYTYGTSGSHTFRNGDLGKAAHTVTTYDGTNNVRISGFNAGTSQNFRLHILALRFGISQVGYAQGGTTGNTPMITYNDILAGTPSMSASSYNTQNPYNFTISYTGTPYPPSPPPEPMGS